MLILMRCCAMTEAKVASNLTHIHSLLLVEHTGVSTCSSSRCHMSPRPLALAAPRVCILLSHTHHHPHTSQPDISGLVAAWVVFSNGLSEIA